MNVFFIAGTDTGAGKTYVTCELLNYLRTSEKKAFAIKPIATGSTSLALDLSMDSPHLTNEDLKQLQQHNPKTEETLSWPISGWQFPTPISPHLAAREMGYALTATAIASFCQHPRFFNLDYLLIEGAGGLYVPLNDKETWIDVLKLLKIPVILVVGMRLGCLNHALLSAHALKSANIPCHGWIANTIDPEMLALEENIQTLVQRMQVPFLGQLTHGGHLNNNPL